MKASNNTFKIYTPVKKSYRKEHLLGYVVGTLFLLGIICCIISRVMQSDTALIIGLVFSASTLLIFIGCIPLAIRATFRYQTLYGDLYGQVIFNSDNVMVNDKVFALSEITKITFSLIDYKGMYIGRQGGIDGRKSQGVENTLSLKVSDTELTYQFQLLYKEQINEIRQQLISYHLKGKLHFLHLIDLLGITRYEDIQQFKKEIGV